MSDDVGKFREVVGCERLGSGCKKLYWGAYALARVDAEIRCHEAVTSKLFLAARFFEFWDLVRLARSDGVGVWAMEL